MKSLINAAACLAASALLALPAAAQQTVYVDDNTCPGVGDGSSAIGPIAIALHATRGGLLPVGADRDDFDRFADQLFLLILF